MKIRCRFAVHKMLYSPYTHRFGSCSLAINNQYMLCYVRRTITVSFIRSWSQLLTTSSKKCGVNVTSLSRSTRPTYSKYIFPELQLGLTAHYSDSPILIYCTLFIPRSLDCLECAQLLETREGTTLYASGSALCALHNALDLCNVRHTPAFR